jgi:transcriptional regulator GlxA family with amidase domain
LGHRDPALTAAINMEVALQNIGFAAFPGFQVMSMAATTAFEVANLVLGEVAYNVILASWCPVRVQSKVSSGRLKLAACRPT